MKSPAPGSKMPFFVVMNAGSGAQAAAEREAAIRDVLGADGRRCEILKVTDSRQLVATAKRAVALAVEHEGAVGVAGGDGTINAVVQQVLGCGRPLAVLPQGTFNFFGRSHHISEDTATAARGALELPAQTVQVGQVNGQVFLVNASLGLYPQILQDREGYKRRYGRSRWVALWSGLQTILRGHRNLRLQLQVGDRQRVVHSPTLVIDNNRLQLEQIGIDQATRVERGELVAIAVKPVSTREMLWLALRGVLGRLGDADRVEIFNFRKLRVEPRMRYGQRRIKVAVDGEIIRLTSPLTFKVSNERLELLGIGSAATEAGDRDL